MSKLRSMIFGNDYKTQRHIPGINGAQTELYVGQEIKGIHGRNGGTITSMELDRQAGVVLVRATDCEGKPYRCWTNNQTPRPHEYADTVGVPVEGSTLRFEDTPPAPTPGEKQPPADAKPEQDPPPAQPVQKQAQGQTRR